jgi:hypothetical protein
MSLDPVAQGDPHVPAHNAEREAINDLTEAMPSKIDKPNSPPLGSLLRWNGDDWVPSNMRLFEGVGSPEGVVAAPPGSRYVDTDASSGVSEWWKQGGESNTGWATLNAGTPWTNINLGAGYAHAAGNLGQYSSLNGVTYFRGAVRRTSGSGTAVGSISGTLAPLTTLQSSVRVGSTEGVLFSIAPSGALAISSSVASNQDIYLQTIAGTPYRR